MKLTEIFHHQGPPTDAKGELGKAHRRARLRRAVLTHLRMRLATFTILLTLPHSAYGLTLEAGLGLLEQGDDRQQLAMTASLGHKNYTARMIYYSRSFSPVTQQTTMVHLLRGVSLTGLRGLEAAFGLALMNEGTYIKYSHPDDKAADQYENQFNAGAAAGVYWALPFGRSWTLRLGWESAIFPAGLIGGLFLVSGRKQLIFMATGAQF